MLHFFNILEIFIFNINGFYYYQSNRSLDLLLSIHLNIFERKNIFNALVFSISTWRTNLSNERKLLFCQQSQVQLFGKGRRHSIDGYSRCQKNHQNSTFSRSNSSQSGNINQFSILEFCREMLIFEIFIQSRNFLLISLKLQ